MIPSNVQRNDLGDRARFQSSPSTTNPLSQEQHVDQQFLRQHWTVVHQPNERKATHGLCGSGW